MTSTSKEPCHETIQPDEPVRPIEKPTLPSNPTPHCCEVPVQRNDAPLSADELLAVREHEQGLIETVRRFNAGNGSGLYRRCPPLDRYLANTTIEITHPNWCFMDEVVF